MPKDQTTKWREAKQRYRAKLRDNQGQPQQTDQSQDDDDGGFWTS
jgi:hypothetical protein